MSADDCEIFLAKDGYVIRNMVSGRTFAVPDRNDKVAVREARRAAASAKYSTGIRLPYEIKPQTKEDRDALAQQNAISQSRDNAELSKEQIAMLHPKARERLLAPIREREAEAQRQADKAERTALVREIAEELSSLRPLKEIERQAPSDSSEIQAPVDRDALDKDVEVKRLVYLNNPTIETQQAYTDAIGFSVGIDIPAARARKAAEKLAAEQQLEQPAPTEGSTDE